MLYLYRFLINVTLVISPIIFIYRLIKRKETLRSYKQKIGFINKKKIKKKLIWFHGASVGEFQSVVPLLEKFEKSNLVDQILITSNTLSSSEVIKKYKFKKIVHHFYPLDTNFNSKKFIDYWQPSKVFFIDSEIWPNMIINLKNKKIPIILINARITKKTFNRWINLNYFAKNIFSKFNLCLPSNKETLKYLKLLGAKKIKFIGNLKYSQSENKIPKISQRLKKFFDKKKIWCASSTHESEELLCARAHIHLKKKFKNLVTIIVPRHIERSEEIKKDLEKLKLNVHLDETNHKIRSNTDIYLVNSYGKTKIFFRLVKTVFLGGSFIEHGGQNPLEATRFGCNVLSGPHVGNFNEIYQFLEKKKISQQITNQKELIKKLNYLFKSNIKANKMNLKLKLLGKKILKQTFSEINIY